MKNLSLSIFIMLLITSCNTNEKSTSVIWVSGFQTQCDKGAGNSKCLLVTRDQNLDDASWDLFYSDIEGFEFEEGQLKQIEVLEEQLSEDAIPADHSDRVYRMVSVLKSNPDHRTLLQSDWELELINGDTLLDSLEIPSLSIDLNKMSMGGNTGCNSYSAAITDLGMKSLQFSDLAMTLKLCPEENYEAQFVDLLSKVNAYKVDESNLELFDSDNNQLLSFTKSKGTKNSVRIHDIWAGVRVGGFPINRMVTIPRLEINTTEMKIYGNDGCNDYFGTISELTESKITIQNIGGTRKMCPEMEFPQRYMDALKQIYAYNYKNGFLIFYNRDQKEILAFIKVD